MNADPHPTRFCCRWFGVILVGVLGMLPHPATVAQPTQPSEPFFAEQVAPILEQNCLNCHHPDNDKGDLSLATKEDFDEAGLVGGALGLSEGDSVIRWKSSGDAQERPTALIAGATNAHRMGKPRGTLAPRACAFAITRSRATGLGFPAPLRRRASRFRNGRSPHRSLRHPFT